jgi:thiamine biosynthesis lipoprotein
LADSRRRLVIEIVAFAAVLALVFFLSRRAQGPDSVDEHRLAMGTLVSVAVFGAEADGARSAIEAAFDEVARVEALTTRYGSEGAIALLNRRGGGAASLDAARVIARSLVVSEVTGGAFDITVAPLVDLWVFGDGAALPEHSEIRRALEHVDYRRVVVDTTDPDVALPSGAAVDLDGIAKGYAVDRAVAVLRAGGAEAAIVDAGGDVGLLGRSPRPGGWRIGVKHPRLEGLLGVLKLDGGSVATSGDYQRCAFIDGTRYHHVLDPSTGYPARGVISVTVTAERCVDADALATAVFVMGARDGLAFVEATDGVEAIIVSGEEEVEDVLVSSGLRDRFDEAR